MSITDIGSVGKKIQKIGVPVKALRMRRGVPDLRKLWRLASQFKMDKPPLYRLGCTMLTCLEDLLHIGVVVFQ